MHRMGYSQISDAGDFGDFIFTLYDSFVAIHTSKAPEAISVLKKIHQNR
jgi:hypothetical protein